MIGTLTPPRPKFGRTLEKPASPGQNRLRSAAPGRTVTVKKPTINSIAKELFDHAMSLTKSRQWTWKIDRNPSQEAKNSNATPPREIATAIDPQLTRPDKQRLVFELVLSPEAERCLIVKGEKQADEQGIRFSPEELGVGKFQALVDLISQPKSLLYSVQNWIKRSFQPS